MVRKRTYCINCSSFVAGDSNGTCRKHGWAINMKLAESDKPCSYDSFKNTFLGESSDFVEVLTPLNESSLITQDAYMNQKHDKNAKQNFWHLPRKRTVKELEKISLVPHN